ENPGRGEHVSVDGTEDRHDHDGADDQVSTGAEDHGRGAPADERVPGPRAEANEPQERDVQKDINRGDEPDRAENRAGNITSRLLDLLGRVDDVVVAVIRE